MPLLKVRNIETYYGPIMAIKGVSFDVNEEDIVTILGANGAGKTTILKTICGIMDPEKGEIKQLRSEKELNNNRVTEAVEDRNQMVWIGGFGGELLQYDPSSDKLKV